MFVETDVRARPTTAPAASSPSAPSSSSSTKHAGLQKYGITEEMAREKLLAVGFAETTTRSWRCRLAHEARRPPLGRLAHEARAHARDAHEGRHPAARRADQPSRPGQRQVGDGLPAGLSLTNVSSIIVSHDIKVLDQVCTHVLQIDNLKLKHYKGNLSDVAQNYVPEAALVLRAQGDQVHDALPDAGQPRGHHLEGQAHHEDDEHHLHLPGRAKAQLTGVTVRVSLSTRAAVHRRQRRGQVDDDQAAHRRAEPDKGEGGGRGRKHPNARVAYVAQHAFHHIENHLEKTPNEYIRWRYEHGSDKEGLEKVTTKLTEEEEDHQEADPDRVQDATTARSSRRSALQALHRRPPPDAEVQGAGVRDPVDDSGFKTWVPRRS